MGGGYPRLLGEGFPRVMRERSPSLAGCCRQMGLKQEGVGLISDLLFSHV